MSPQLVDFHCHLDLFPDHAAEVERCEKEGIFTLTVTTTPKAWGRNRELTHRTRHVRAALGLHPQLVEERAHEIALWEELLPQTRYVGEVGLDAGPRFYKSFEKQKEVFSRVLSVCARAGGKVLTVHSVRATKVVLDMIEAHLPSSRGRVVLHWFTGTAAEARRAVDLGCYFSINSAMLEDEKRSVIVKGMPRDRLLTETDAPFTQMHNQPSRPSDVKRVVSGLARLFVDGEMEIEREIVKNLRMIISSAE